MSAERTQLYRRGQLLLQHNRLEEAESAFRELAACDPDDAEAFLWLAITVSQFPDRAREALQVMERAQALLPDEWFVHAQRSRILTRLRQYKEAHEAADQARALDPDATLPFVVKAEAFCGQERWADAERSLLQALNRDPDDTHAGNLLAQVLRLQGKTHENQAAVEHLLAEDPESFIGHCNAGYGCLQRGDVTQAERHFRESLRLHAEFDPAREGLLLSYRARSPFYRGYLKYCFWMQRFTGKGRLGIIIGIYIAFRLLTSAASGVSPVAAGFLVLAYMLLVLWVWVADGVGNLLILLDHQARPALKAEERCEAIFVGGGLVFGVLLMICGTFGGVDAMLNVGLLLAIAALPGSLAFTNPSPMGRRIFLPIFAAGWALALAEAAMPLLPERPAVMGTLFGSYILACVATTWLGCIGTLRRAPAE